MALNEKDLKDFASFIGIDVDKVESLDKAKEELSKNFISKSQIKDSPEFTQAWGQKMGGIETAVKRLVKENGVELTADAIKDKKIDELIDIATVKLKDHYTQKFQTLEDQIKNNDATKVVEEWKNKYNQAEQKVKDTENLLSLTKTELDTVKQNSVKTINEFKLNDVQKRALDSIPFSKDINDVTKTGFKAILSEKYMLDLDEHGNAYIKDKTNNSRIPNPAKMGEFMNIDDVYKLEAEKNNLVAKVDKTKKDATFVKKTPEDVGGGIPNPTFNNPRRITFRERQG